MRTRFPIAVFMFLFMSVPVFAGTGLALIIANENYESVRDARGATTLLQVVRRYEDAGFRVEMANDLSAAAMRSALSQMSAGLATSEHERVVVVFAGNIISSDSAVWLMGIDARNPDFASIDGQGVRLETVLAMVGQVQGGALVALADFGFAALPPGLRPGLPPQVSVPQGVTLVRGPVQPVTNLLRESLTPGTNLPNAALRQSGLRVEGFAPRYLPFLPVGHIPTRDADREAWSAAVSAASLAGYQAYLSAYPSGTYADQARAEVQRLLNTPERIEAALNLTRDERRAIQRDLTILGFDPRGIDGVFGGGTRAALRLWQGNNRFESTGFLNREQILSMAQQAARRAAQLEAEARARQAEQERQDRAFWRDTGSGTDEVGLRAYLSRFPDGVFSAVAQQRLDQIEADRRAAALARDRAAWDIAAGTDTIDAYRAYLRDFPSGAFADQARARMEELSRPPEPVVDMEAARAAEDALMLPQFTRAIIEQRLTRLGLEPGPADGTFDRDTRRAIRRYQRASDLPVTGFLTQPIVARLLTEGFLDILR